MLDSVQEHPYQFPSEGMDLRALQKVELHLHLDCSLSYNVVHEIEPSVSYEAYRSRFIAPAKCTDLAEFLARAPEGFRLMQTEERLRLVTADLFRQLHADNVIYAEVRFAPLLHTEGGLSPEDVVGIVDEAARDSVRATGIEARLLLCTLRHFSEAQSLQTADLAGRFRNIEGSLVAGFDIAGDEAGYPINTHVSAYKRAHALGVPCTAHAGEARGAGSVWETLENLRPARIGHGVRSVEDPALIEHLKGHGIHLEVCPSSNVQTNVVGTYADHPADRLYRNGVSFGINTDARTITDVTLTQEYERLRETFGWGAEHFLRCNTDAMGAAFLPEARRNALLSRIQAAYERAIDEDQAPVRAAIHSGSSPM